MSEKPTFRETLACGFLLAACYAVLPILLVVPIAICEGFRDGGGPFCVVAVVLMMVCISSAVLGSLLMPCDKQERKP